MNILIFGLFFAHAMVFIFQMLELGYVCLWEGW